MSADKRVSAERQSRPRDTRLVRECSSSMPVSPLRCAALKRMPVLSPGPKRRAMSVDSWNWPPLDTPVVTRVRGSFGARLGTRLITPPMPPPPGAAPVRKVDAPRSTSTRSNSSVAMYWRGSRLYRPL